MDSSSVNSAADNQALLDAGYQPRLSRSLGFFSSFAISFSYMSVLTGIFANYGFLLGKAGPFGIWTWLLVGVGQTLAALVFAEMAGRIPLTGCSYNWNAKLLNPAMGWFAGWMALIAYSIGVAAVTVTIVPILTSITGHKFDANISLLLGIALIVLQAAINVYGVRIAAHLNVAAVAAEILALTVFSVLLAASFLSNSHASFDVITTVPQDIKSYFPLFLMACLLGSWTLLGFEGAADIAEETINVRRVSPKSIINAILSCVVMGFVFILLLTLNITDVKGISASSDPVTDIVSGSLGNPLTKVFLALVLLSMLACSLVNMTGASRVMFAMARDGRFVFSRLLGRVSEHKVPANATWLVAVLAASFLSISNATALYGSGAVLFNLFYLVTVIGYLAGSKKLPPTDTFSLGKWRWPIGVAAGLWLIIEVGILTVPADFHSVARATVAILAIGVIFYLLHGRNKGVLPTSRELP